MALHPSWIWIQNLSNSLNHIYHLVSPSSLPILFFDEFALHNNQVCQKIVTGSAGSSAVAGGFGAGGVGNFSVVAAVYLVFEHTGCSAGGTEHFDLANHHLSPLLYFYEWGNFGPYPHFSVVCFGATVAWGISASWGCALTFIVGMDVGAGEIGQSFLDSNRFSDIDPALGHGVLALIGIFSSGGRLLSAKEPPWNLLGFSLG